MRDVLYKKGMVLAILCLFIGTGVPSIVADFNQNLENESLIITLKSGSYNLVRDDEDKTIITMEGFDSILIPGGPTLPSKTYLIGLPPGAKVTSISILDEKKEVLDGRYEFQPNYLIIDDGSERIELYTYEEDFSITDSFPSDAYEYLGIGQMRKYNFARVNFHPFQYTFSTGELMLYKEIILQIEYEIVEEVSDELLHDDTLDDIAAQIIFNYEEIHPYYNPKTTCTNLDSYDYVIITPDSFEESLESLRKWKEYIGYSVQVVGTSWIYNTYSGCDSAEKIRNFLIDKYAEWGIKYVLIVGTNSLIPMRYCYPKGETDDYSGYKILTDHYYADLTGDWNSDGDDYFGECDDDNFDLIADVFVGRIPMYKESDIEDLCQKIIAFEQDGGYWKNNALLFEAKICGDNDYCNDFMEERMKNDLFIPEGFNVVTMYEKEGLEPSPYTCNYPLTYNNLLNEWSNNEFGIVTWVAHGSPDGISRLVWVEDKDGDGDCDDDEDRYYNLFSKSDSEFLNDEKPSIIFATSCSTANPTIINNLCYALLNNGAVAYVGSSGRAWVGYYTSHHKRYYTGGLGLQFVFYKNLFTESQNIGEAIYNAKYYCWDNGYHDDYLRLRNVFMFSLYGDPSISLNEFQGPSAPETPDKPSGPELAKPGTLHNFNTSSTHGENLEIYYKWDFGDGWISDWTGPYFSGELCNLSHNWNEKGTYVIKVKATTFIGPESDWSEPLTIKISKSKHIFPFMFLILNRLVGRFPILEQILQIIYII